MSLFHFLYEPNFAAQDFGFVVDNSSGCESRFRPRHQSSEEKDALFRPSLDLHEDVEGNKVTLRIDLPGMKKEDVKIDVHPNRLVISGETATSSEDKDEGYTVRERHHGKFSRSVRLPKGTKPGDVEASMEDGVLIVTFPKTHPDQEPSRVSIA